MERCKIRYLLFMLIAAISISEYSYGQKIKLHGSMVHNEYMRLYWNTRGWPQDLYGFNIKKRTDSSEWTKLHEQPIIPSLSPDRNWNNIGLNTDQQQRISSKFKQLVEEGALKVIAPTELLEILRKRGGLASGDRLKMKADFDYALILGFGYVDNDFNPDQKTEYGIFFVSNDLREKSEPLSVFSPKDFSDLQLDVKFTRLGKDLELLWELDKATFESMGSLGFNLTRQTKTAGDISLARGLSVWEEEEEVMRWRYRDTNVDNTSDQIYIVSPADMFQGEIKRFVVSYEATFYEPLVPPNIIEIDTVNDIDVIIKWDKIDTQTKKRIKGAIIERTSVGKFSFKEISELISADSTQYIDKGLKKHGNTFIYRIKWVDAKDNTWLSEQKRFLYIGQAKPPKLKDGKAELIELRGEKYIELTWNEKAPLDTVTAGYKLASDMLKQGEMLLMASVPLIKDNSYLYKINGDGGRPVTFNVIPVSTEGASTTPLVLTCNVGSLLLPYFSAFKATFNQDYTVNLSWTYPELEDLIGYRIYMNSELIADEKQVSDTTRWLVTNPQRDAQLLSKYQIEAVGQIATRKSLVQSLFIGQDKPDTSIEPPTDLKAVLFKKEKKLYAKISWDPIDFDKQGVLGYILYADDAKEGVVLRKSNLPLIKSNIYLFELPQDKRKQYTFRIAAMTKERQIAPYAETLFDKTKKNTKEGN